MSKKPSFKTSVRKKSIPFFSKHKAGVLVAAALLATGCISAVVMAIAPNGNPYIAATGWTPYYLGSTATTASKQAMSNAILTQDGTDTLTVNSYQNDLYMSAPAANTGGNNRNVIWPTSSKKVADSITCATWLGGSDGQVQQGLAARIIPTENGRAKAITVTKNVIYGVHWVFNMHVWDGTMNDPPFHAFAQYDMSDIITNKIGAVEYMPWNTCMVVRGNTIRFKIWFPEKMAEPSWSDAKYVKTTTIPDGYDQPGYSGWYVGHIPPGGNTEYLNLSLRTGK